MMLLFASSIKMIIIQTPSPFLKCGKINFDYLPRRGRGESEKLKKRSGSMVQEQVFLKGGMSESRGNCLKYLKMGWNRTERRGHKDFKKGGASWVKEWVP